MKKNVDPNVMPHWYSFAMAEGFYRAGLAEAIAMPPTQETPFEELISFISAAAVNLAFSMELYLKTIHMLTHNKAAKGHLLWDIFNALPTNFQEHIRDDYSRGYAREGRELKGFYINQYYTGDPEPTPTIDFSFSEDLDSLLKEHNQTFIDFRYLYEPIINGHENRVDLNGLNILCKTLRHAIKQMIAVQNNPGVKVDILALYQRE